MKESLHNNPFSETTYRITELTYRVPELTYRIPELTYRVKERKKIFAKQLILFLLQPLKIFLCFTIA